MKDGIKRLAILGCTGSIGQQTLQVIRTFPERFEVVGLAAGSNRALLERQAAEFKPRAVHFAEGDDRRAGSGRSSALPKKLSLEEMASLDEVDLVVIATSGKAGLSPLLSALRAGKQVALANKEALVMAGEIVTREAHRHRARLLPVDSEHSAIWQCLRGEKEKPYRILLTASGGPFARYTKTHLSRVTPEEALRHPTWSMGKKVTIDSATLMNKGMEVIEARWLFNVPLDRIQVLVHPQSIVHSMVEFGDGSVKAQLSQPDMRLPIQYALTYPERRANDELPRLDWSKTGTLNFELPDVERFPCLKLAIEAAAVGGTAPAVLCAADEVAVDLFLSGHLAFLDIPRLVGRTLDRHKHVTHPSLEEIMQADGWARETAAILASRGQM
jgi:1-deoxy-D-xylulose-5-phosphate reductoisomerase